MKTVKCLLAVIAIAFCFQVSAEKKNIPFVELQPTINGSSGFSIQTGFMRNVNKNLLFGMGMGISESFKFNHISTIPLFVRGQIEKEIEGGVTPYFSFDLGYGLNVEDFGDGRIILNPNVGVRFTNIYAGIGYMGTIATSGSGGISSALSVKLGYSFGRNDDAIRRFMRKTDFGLEAGYGFGCSKVDAKEYSNSGKKDDKVTLGTNLFMNLTWLYRLTDNWSTGIGIGVKCYTVEFDYNEAHIYEFSGSSEKNTNFSIPLFVRGKYVFFDEDKQIRPFLACDLGG